MNTTIYEKDIFNDIYSDISTSFGFEFRNVEQIKRGWLNLKWKIETDVGTYLIKQYNKDRMKKYSVADLNLVFEQQNILHNIGFPCPRILSHQEKVLFQSPGGEQFIMMEYCPGKNIKPGKLSEEQMYQLGYFTGKLHSELNNGRLPVKNKPEFIPPSSNEREAYWKSIHKEIYNANKFDLLPVIEKQIELMGTFNFDTLQIDKVGWAHRDLWVDNILFDRNKLSAILDFDRMKFDHLNLDVGRAVISGALDGNFLNINNAIAFLDGYRMFQETGPGFLKDSLTLLWYMESEWWLDSMMDERKGPPKRFVQEMIWLSEHLMELGDMLGGK